MTQRQNMERAEQDDALARKIAEALDVEDQRAIVYFDRFHELPFATRSQCVAFTERMRSLGIFMTQGRFWTPRELGAQVARAIVAAADLDTEGLWKALGSEHPFLSIALPRALEGRPLPDGGWRSLWNLGLACPSPPTPGWRLNTRGHALAIWLAEQAGKAGGT